MSDQQVSNDELLQNLDNERRKFQHSDESRMREIVCELQSRGVYPLDTMPDNPNTVWDMVQGWGAYWTVYKGHLNCPNCGANLRDLKTGPPFKREIGMVEDDRCVHSTCPDCGDVFPLLD